MNQHLLSVNHFTLTHAGGNVTVEATCNLRKVGYSQHSHRHIDRERLAFYYKFFTWGNRGRLEAATGASRSWCSEWIFIFALAKLNKSFLRLKVNDPFDIWQFRRRKCEPKFFCCWSEKCRMNNGSRRTVKCSKEVVRNCIRDQQLQDCCQLLFVGRR